MGAARAHTTEGADGGEGLPPAFRQAVGALTAVRPRHEVRLDPLPPPRRLAPYAHAVEASVTVDDEELADGRFVLLHDPRGQEGWHGTFRVVTLARAELEAEMAADPLLPEVTWSWLTGALEARGATYEAPSGTVTRSSSHYFGDLAERAPQAEIEIRASWTAPADREPVPDTAAHLLAWCELLGQCAGLPPESGQHAGVVQLPQRRGPHPL
ncbi:DUF3000 domain-containing protein [Streptomyces durbertensis]|uniref:DUF3000 domain-containing protein n=1 Tax=Streptomyces durbertensis TaxID=2448886 RepID=A0ABR6E9H9_9ACTN|nr:DUF3000 domain-containing protein [Streptomyces durbertensis]MBB1241999.1 DUF3000 domain-containing protein [Streptomyces durbertensis]